MRIALFLWMLFLLSVMHYLLVQRICLIFVNNTVERVEYIKLMEKLIDIMEEDDDVQNIWHNWDNE